MALTQLFIHPLKSGRAQSPASAIVTPQGLKNDRVWLACTPDGQFLTARTKHSLLLVDSTDLGNGQWHFSAPGMPPLLLETASFCQRVPTTVWKSSFSALAGHAAANLWLSEYLGEAAQLLWLGESTRVQKTGSDTLSFADGYPYLLISEASLADLNSRLAQPVSMRHFRPNLVINDGFAYEEDEWQTIRIGEVVFDIVKRCTRCILTTVDPDTATPAADRQPFDTLLAYRKIDNGVCFGVNAVARNSGTLHIGDAVEILESAVQFD